VIKAEIDSSQVNIYEYNHPFKIEWQCPELKYLKEENKIPYQTEINFMYERPDNDKKAKKALLKSKELESFINKIKNSKFDISNCISNFRDELDRRFTMHICPDSERSLNPKLELWNLNDICLSKRNPKLLRPIISQLAKIEVNLAQTSIKVPETIVGGNNNNTESLDRNFAKNIIKSCKYSLEHSPPNYYNNSSKVIALIGDELSKSDQEVSRDCRKKIIASYLRELGNQQMEICDTQELKICNKIKNYTNNSILNLSKSFNELSSKEAQSINHAICNDSSLKIAQSIKELSTEITLANNCVELVPGEEKIIDLENNDSGTGSSAYYKLVRETENIFRAKINIDFRPRSEMKKMEKRLNKCLQKNNKYLKGENNKMLNIEISKDVEIPSVEIYVDPNAMRSHSTLWAKNIKCETMLHEVLHLLGLVDEYEEKMVGYVFNKKTGEIRLATNKYHRNYFKETFFDGFDCRVTGPMSSIMNDQFRAFDEVTGWFPSKTSLLYPAHFKAITMPGCNSVNRTYYSCASYTQQTSTNQLGDGCEKGKSDKCKNGSEEWLK